MFLMHLMKETFDKNKLDQFWIYRWNKNIFNLNYEYIIKIRIGKPFSRDFAPIKRFATFVGCESVPD